MLLHTEGNILTITIDKALEVHMLVELMREVEKNELPSQRECKWKKDGIDAIGQNEGKPLDQYTEAIGAQKYLTHMPVVPNSRPKTLVLSYASQNRDYVEDFCLQAKPLLKDNKIHLLWDDEKNREQWWEDAIKDMFEHADGFIMFFSKHYFDEEHKKFIHEVEIPIMERVKNEKKVYECAVLVEPVGYVPKILQKFNMYGNLQCVLPCVSDKGGRDHFFAEFVKKELEGKFIPMQNRK